ncbi:hypothetical protein [Arenibacterium sp. LLYu02]|uniref:hypothetical protein n=1 Tax=Arenibacterium sp. LLYu02 TaxID=3404132 RepID=UPI003B20F5E4
MKLEIEMELVRLGAINPKKTVNPEEIRQNLSAFQSVFDTALSELTLLEQVGMISGEIYLRRSLNQ